MDNRGTDCEVIHEEIVGMVRKTMPSEELLEGLADFYKVMGDQTRIRLLWALDRHEMCVCDLSVLLNMTKSAVSHQLKALRMAKLVKSRRDGKHVFYALNDNHVREILELAMEHLCEKGVHHHPHESD